MSLGQAAGFGQPAEAPLKLRGIRRRLAARHDRRRAKGPPARRIDGLVEATRTSRRARSGSEVGQPSTRAWLSIHVTMSFSRRGGLAKRLARSALAR